MTRNVICNGIAFLMCTCACVQNDDARQELHALGFVDGHEGQQSLSVKFYLLLDTQKGNDMGNKR